MATKTDEKIEMLLQCVSKMQNEINELKPKAPAKKRKRTVTKQKSTKKQAISDSPNTMPISIQSSLNQPIQPNMAINQQSSMQIVQLNEPGVDLYNKSLSTTNPVEKMALIFKAADLNNKMALYTLATGCWNIGQYDKSAEYMLKCASLGGVYINNANMLRAMADHVIKTDFNKAIEYYNTALTLFNNNLEFMSYVTGKLGIAYMREKHDYQKAKEYFKKYKSTDSLCMGGMGYLYYNGYGVDIDKEKGFHLMDNAYKMNSQPHLIESWVILGEEYYLGRYIKKNVSTALKLLNMSKDPKALMNIYKIYKYEKYPLEQMYKFLKENYTKNFYICLKLIKSYIKTPRYDQDIYTGFTLMEQLIHLNYTKALCYKGTLYAIGFKNIIPKDTTKAIEIFKQCIEKEHKKAAKYLFELMDNSTEKEEEKYLYAKIAAEEGNVPCMLAYATYCEDRNNNKEALEIYKKLHDMEHYQGSEKLAIFYQYGIEVDKNMEKSFDLYKKTIKYLDRILIFNKISIDAEEFKEEKKSQNQIERKKNKQEEIQEHVQELNRIKFSINDAIPFNERDIQDLISLCEEYIYEGAEIIKLLHKAD
jgi:TPR repeat protein